MSHHVVDLCIQLAELLLGASVVIVLFRIGWLTIAHYPLRPRERVGRVVDCWASRPWPDGMVALKDLVESLALV